MVGTVGNFDVAVLKLDPEGNLDPAFGTDGAFVFENDLSSDQAYSMAALPDGRIIVGGAMGFGGSDYRATVWCLLPDGTPDPDFGTEGRFQYTFDDGEEYIRRVLVTNTHITMVATVKVPGFSYDRIGLVQCTHDGVLDQGFGQDGAIIHTIDDTTDLSVRDGERMSNGGIAVCGYHYNMTDNTEYPFIGLFDAAGQPQAGFGNGGIIIADNQPGEYFAMATAGDILYFAGRTNGDVRDFMIDALHTDGTTYTPFAVYGHFELDNALTDLILDLVIDEEGRLLASGTSGIPGFFGDRDFALLRLLPDGTPDPLFGTDGLTTTTFGERLRRRQRIGHHARKQGCACRHERPDQQRLCHRPLHPWPRYRWRRGVGCPVLGLSQSHGQCVAHGPFRTPQQNGAFERHSVKP